MLKKIYQHIGKTIQAKSVWNYIILHAHNPAGAEEAEEKMLALTGKKTISTVDISPVIGMHAGNGAIAVSIMYNN